MGQSKDIEPVCAMDIQSQRENAGENVSPSPIQSSESIDITMTTTTDDLVNHVQSWFINNDESTHQFDFVYDSGR